MGTRKIINRICNLAVAALLSQLLAGCAGGANPLINDNVTASTTTETAPADLVFVNARVYTAPGATPITSGTVIVKNGKVVSVRKTLKADAELPTQTLIDANGRALSAGLWNSHVHFTSPELGSNPQGVITNMLLRHGFTHVVDTGSTLEQTLKLRGAIASGALQGPTIVLANGSFVYTDGSPSYLPGIQLPEVTTPAAAEPMVNAVLDAGANGIKIFSGSFISPTETVLLPAAVIEAITETAHKRNSFVIAHPTNIEGLTNAVNGNVDVLAHTTAPEIDIPEAVLARMQAQDTALIPTLMLWRYEMLKFTQSEAQAEFMENAAVTQLRTILAAEIPILFGTDVGYMEDFDPAAEYRLMAQAGMDWPGIHRALTSEPTQRFGRFANRTSATIQEGASADLVLFNGDPAANIETVANVAYTIIAGKVVYSDTANP